MGPHGLIIGATGSGKSEVLRTLVLALALTHSLGGPQLRPGRLQGRRDVRRHGRHAARLGDHHQPRRRAHARRPHAGRAAGRDEPPPGAAARRGQLRQRHRLREGPHRRPPTSRRCRRCSSSSTSSPSCSPPSPSSSTCSSPIGRLGRSLQMHLLLASQRLEEGRLRGLESHLSYRIGLRTFSAAESPHGPRRPRRLRRSPPSPASATSSPTPRRMIQFRASYVSGPPPSRRSVTAGGAGRAGNARIELVHGRAGARRDEPSDEAPVVVVDDAARSARPSTSPSSGWPGRPARPPGVAPAARRAEHASTSSCPTSSSTRSSGLVSPRLARRRRLVIPLGIVDRPLEQRRENLTLALGGAARPHGDRRRSADRQEHGCAPW